MSERKLNLDLRDQESFPEESFLICSDRARQKEQLVQRLRGKSPHHFKELPGLGVAGAESGAVDRQGAAEPS